MFTRRTTAETLALFASVLLICGGVTGTARAAVSFNSISRTVSATSDGLSQSFTQPTFGVFDRVASVTGPVSGLSEARQVSTVNAGGDSVAFMGSARTTFDFPNPSSSALSSLELTFTIDTLTPYEGQLVYFPGFPAATNPPQVFIRDATSGLTIVNLIVTAGPMGALNGQLNPGQYTLVISVPNPNPMMTTNGGSSSVSLGLAFVPAPASATLLAFACPFAFRRRRTRGG